MKRNSRFAGTTLVITLALLAALAIIGTTMISMARMDRFAARSYRYNTQMDLAADAALEWFGARWSEEYWTREVPYYQGTVGTAATAKPNVLPSAWNSYDVCLPGATAVASRGDSPYDDDSLITELGITSPLTASTPQLARVNNANLSYKITTAAQTTNVPVAAWPIPNAAADGYIYPELRFPAGPNRTVEVSLTAVDLDGRLNVNFTGSYDSRIVSNNGLTYASGVCSNWRGDSIQQVTPPNSILSWSHDLENVVAGSTPQPFGTGIGRYGPTSPASTYASITSELVDGSMNPFAPGLYASLAGTVPGVSFSPSTHPLPYGLEDLAELLNVYGASTGGMGSFTSRLQSQASGGSLGPSTAKALVRSMVTTHSWTSAARRNFYYPATATLNENPAAQTQPYVKADLNNAPQGDLEKALLATRMFLPTNTTTDMCVMEQIVANIMDYRRECNHAIASTPAHAGPGAAYLGHPTALSPVTAGITVAGGQIYGVQRQPYINEVYVKLKDNVGTPTGTTSKGNKGYKWDVFIELANPYDLPLYYNQEFTDMWVGDDSSDSYGNSDVTKCSSEQFDGNANILTAMGATPIPAAPSPGLAGGCVVGVVVVSDSRNPFAAIVKQVQPIRLFNTATNGNPVLIDRMSVDVPPAFTTSTQLAGNTTSCQRPTYNLNQAAIFHNGTQTTAATGFFGGYMEKAPVNPPVANSYDQIATKTAAMTSPTDAAPYCTALASVTNALPISPNGSTLVRPVENRSRTWYTNATTPVRTRAFYPAWGAAPSSTTPELSFACPGDLCRLLIIGPGFGYQTGGSWSANGTLGFYTPSNSMAGGGVYTVTEQLGATLPGSVPDECDMHIDIAKISTKTSPASGGASGNGGVPYDWRRLLDVFDVNSPWYDGLDNSGKGRVIDYQPNTNAIPPVTPADYVGELYEHGRINLLTAPSLVLQGMVGPLGGMVSKTNPSLTTLTTMATYNAYRHFTDGSKIPWKSPADILDIQPTSGVGWAQSLFATSNCDDDGNGAFNDYAKKCWLYTFMSNWATIRSDCVAVYGTVRLMDASVSTTQPQGLRHFVAVMDRVPATAYQPLLPSGAYVKPNPNYQPPRRVMLTWLD